jgi:hypothetical protein
MGSRGEFLYDVKDMRIDFIANFSKERIILGVG